MLVAIARVKSADATVKVVNGWLKLPVLDARALVKEALEADVGDVIDLSQPMDAAAMVGALIGRPSVLSAVSLPIADLEVAREKLARRGLRVASRDGGWLVEGFGEHTRVAEEEEGEDGSPRPPRSRKRRGRDKEGVVCFLVPAAPAPPAARLVCGELAAAEALAPWLARTAPRRTYPADVHAELRPIAVRDQVLAFKPALPSMVRSFTGGTSPAERDLVDAGVAEVTDLATDVDRVTMDATIEGEGASLVTRVEHGKASSTTAQLALEHPERAGAPPPAFWRLPAETEIVLYGHGSDPKLLERPRQLVSAWVFEQLTTSIAEADRRAVQDLFGNRLLPLLTGQAIWAKGTSEAGITKAAASYATERDKATEGRAFAVAKNELTAQAIGWHLLRLEEPVTRIGPLLKDVVKLWGRPSFARYRKELEVKLSPLPAGVKLPADTVHLELRAVASPDPKAKKGTLPLPRPVLHVFAVPDSGATWIALGMDGRLAGDRVASVLGGASGKDTLASVPAFAGLRDVTASSAMVFTVRGFVTAALADHDLSLLPKLSASPSKGLTPIPLVLRAEGRGTGAAAGASTTTMKLPKAAIEDVVTLLL